MNVRYFDIKRRGLYICDTFSAYNPYVNRLRFLLHLTHQFWSLQTSGMSKCQFCCGYQYFGGALPKSWRPVIFVIPENAGNKLYPNFGTWIHSTRLLYCRKVEVFLIPPPEPHIWCIYVHLDATILRVIRGTLRFSRAHISSLIPFLNRLN
jgi:hypothetical protein